MRVIKTRLMVKNEPMIRQQVVVAWLLLPLGSVSPCAAQQVYTQVPLVGARDSFYESFGTDWGFSHRGRNGYVFFNRGGANTGIPVFGGHDPNADARFGFGTRGRHGSFYFNAWAGQGSTRTITSATGSLMLQNGGRGYVQDISVQPFVTGLVPVVGNGAVSPVEERLERLRQEAAIADPQADPTDAELLLGAAKHDTANDARPAGVAGPPPVSSRSSAERGDISLAEIRRQQAIVSEASREEEVQSLIATAELAAASGRWGAARIRYQQAAAKTTGALRRALLAKADRLGK